MRFVTFKMIFVWFGLLAMVYGVLLAMAESALGVGYYVGCMLGFAHGNIYAWQGTSSIWTRGDNIARFESPIDRAVNYLVSHFNSTIGLIYESEEPDHNRTYYIYNDNLVAAWALKPFNPSVSQKINETIQAYNLPPSLMVEVLFGYPIPTIISTANIVVVEQYPDRVIKAELHNTTTPLLWQNYSDTLIYRSFYEYLRGNLTGAIEYFNMSYKMWDDKGVWDLATEVNKTYANYKLALILYAFKVLNLSENDYQNITKIENKLWSMQNQETGGIISLADLNGNPIGSANAETTSIALLPYNVELIERMRSLFGKYIQNQLNISIATNGGETIPSPGTYTYLNGTQIRIKAIPHTGFSFDHWLLDGHTSTENPITIIMDANYTFVAYFIDNIAPQISQPIQEPPDEIQAHQEVRVWVNVTDLGTGIKNVTLWYSLNNGTTWTIINMTAYREIYEALWGATIPGYGNCTWVTYKIVAYDNAENMAVEENNSYYYQYHVIPEFSSIMLLLVMLILAPLTATIAKKNKLFYSSFYKIGSEIDACKFG